MFGSKVVGEGLEPELGVLAEMLLLLLLLLRVVLDCMGENFSGETTGALGDKAREAEEGKCCEVIGVYGKAFQCLVLPGLGVLDVPLFWRST